MKKVLAIAVCLIGVNQAVFAASPLVGNWKYVSQSCQSGAAMKQDPNMSISMAMQVALAETTMSADMTAKIQMNQSYANQLIGQLNAAKTWWDSQPDSQEKQDALTQIQNSYSQVSKYAAGVTCSMQETADYSLNGSSMTSTVTSYKTNCEGSDGQVGQTAVNEYVLQGNVLSLISPVKDADGVCELGDSTVTIFNRL